MKGGNLVKEAEIIPTDDNLINPRTKDGGTSDLMQDEDDDFEMEDEIFD
jgi:hypothetical protein